MAVRSAGLAGICLALACATASAPTVDPAPEPTQRLSGLVVDENGAPFWGATVIVRGGPGVRRAVATRKDGTFSLAVPPGVYDVVARAAPSLDAPYAWQRDVVLRADAPASLRLVAEPKRIDRRCRNSPAKPPLKLSGPDPAYTAEALGQNVEGIVKLTCIVSVEGEVRGCLPFQRLSNLTEPSIRAVEQRTYSPAVCDGKPIEIDYMFMLIFRLPK